MNPDDLTLDALQEWMQDALVFPRRTSAEEIGQIVENSPNLTAAERLGIYQRSYYLRLIKCMEEQFPALFHALRKELFDRFAREYLQALPSASYTLYDLGTRFPDYLEATRPDHAEPEENREDWIDFLVDLARYERELIFMFDAPGHEGRPFADEHVPDERLKLQPCFKLHESRYPVAWYYHEVRQENDPAFPGKQYSPVALVRTDYNTRTYPLSVADHRFLEELLRGKGIRQALETIVAETGKPVEEVSRRWSGPKGLRKHWIEAGFFVDAECLGSGPTTETNQEI